ncbi:FAD/FMN-containing dehydrogenase [Kitasatospora sp. SolWspMP-SS2h]|uniref:FAD-binding protein n=1 Tax=Kitasatospora sp. SolWspMP-SS2h TaxID=1305729 RepID=UPI000DC0153D|nr:FAD-binding protein [Kitasatospora sp. SolWspMP-SS2h]RAJ43054.1 FAD/FMN-containing dehydrogenase [Kitasatospora sp. SolWspMP-SS2h]
MPQPTAPSTAGDGIAGVWRLASYHDLDQDGARHEGPLGPAPEGLLFYAPNGRLSVTMMRTGPARPGDQTFNSYAGTWRREGARVVHTIQLAPDPAWIGTEQVRELVLEGDRLRLYGTALIGPPRRRVLEWHRTEGGEAPRGGTTGDAGAPLAASVQGPVLRPGSEGYDTECAGFQTAYRHRPALVVGAATADDVRAAVGFAAARRWPIAVQGTGHGISAPLRGEGVLITTRRMNRVEVDARARTARMEAGALWKDVMREAARYGLAPLNGSSPGVGVAGYLLGGGTPLLGREFGYACDHVHGVDLVLADGTPRRVTAESDPELFWALRGGGANFGAITSIETELVPITGVYGGGLFFDAADDATDILRAYADWSLTVPEQLTSSIGLMTYPPVPAFPEPLRGRYAAHIRIAFNGSRAEGERLIAPLRAVGPRLVDTVDEMPYARVGSIFGDPDFPHSYYGSNILLRGLDSSAPRMLSDLTGPDVVPRCIVDLRHLGGAMSRPPAVPNAVGGRTAQYLLRVLNGAVGPTGEDPFADARPVHRRLRRAFEPWTVGRSLNFVYGDGRPSPPDEVREFYDPGAYDRLTRLKARYDPDNLFRSNHNLRPASTGRPAPTN